MLLAGTIKIEYKTYTIHYNGVLMKFWKVHTLEAKTSSVKIFVGENFRRSSLAQNFVTFYRRKL